MRRKNSLLMIVAALLGASWLVVPQAAADIAPTTPTGQESGTTATPTATVIATATPTATATATTSAAVTPTLAPTPQRPLVMIRGTVIGFDSMRDPPVVLLLTTGGAVMVELQNRELLDQIDTGKTVVLYGQKTGDFDFSAIGAGEPPANASTVAASGTPTVAEPTPPPAADLSGMVDGVNSFTVPAIALVRSDDGVVWTVQFQDDGLLTKVRMGRIVYLLGKKTGSDTFEASGVVVP